MRESLRFEWDEDKARLNERKHEGILITPRKPTPQERKIYEEATR